MIGRERGFLLLRSHLGDPNRRPLTQSQLWRLRQLVRNAPREAWNRELEVQDLCDMGCNLREAQHIAFLLSEEEKLDRYLAWGDRVGCTPIAQVSPDYPQRLLRCLGQEAPGCLWAKGDVSLLGMEKIALVGSRDLLPENARFAQKVGRLAAERGIALVSGNARGADSVAQDACLEAGGKVISVVADCLHRYPERENLLYLSEESFDEGFSTHRALSRNRVIHSLGETTYVAQCGLGKGGTWDGATKNLRGKWSRVVCFSDGTPAMEALAALGAELTDEVN